MRGYKVYVMLLAVLMFGLQCVADSISHKVKSGEGKPIWSRPYDGMGRVKIESMEVYWKNHNPFRGVKIYPKNLDLCFIPPEINCDSIDFNPANLSYHREPDYVIVNTGDRLIFKKDDDYVLFIPEIKYQENQPNEIQMPGWKSKEKPRSKLYFIESPTYKWKLWEEVYLDESNVPLRKHLPADYHVGSVHSMSVKDNEYFSLPGLEYLTKIKIRKDDRNIIYLHIENERSLVRRLWEVLHNGSREILDTGRAGCGSSNLVGSTHTYRIETVNYEVILFKITLVEEIKNGFKVETSYSYEDNTEAKERRRLAILEQKRRLAVKEASEFIGKSFCLGNINFLWTKSESEESILLDFSPTSSAKTVKYAVTIRKPKEIDDPTRCRFRPEDIVEYQGQRKRVELPVGKTAFFEVDGGSSYIAINPVEVKRGSSIGDVKLPQKVLFEYRVFEGKAAVKAELAKADFGK